MKRGLMSALMIAALSLVLAVVAAACTEEVIKEVPVVKEVVVEREVIKEVPVEKIVEREVVKEVPVEKIVEKEVVKEVVVEQEVVKRVVREVVATAVPLRSGLAVEAAKYGGDLQVTAQGSIKSLDVGFAPAYVTYAVGSQVWEYPFGLDLSYNIQPQMVDRFNLSADGLTWTFTLRDNLKFHNGKTLTVDAIIGSYPRWIDGSGGGKFVDEYLAPGGLKKLDDRTWTMEFVRTIGGVPEIMGWMYRGLWVFDDVMASKPAGEDASEGELSNLIGSGAYKITQWDVGNKIKIERFEDYVPRSETGSYLAGAKEAYLDSITWIEIPAEETKIAGLKTGEWDMVDGAGLDFFEPLSVYPGIAIANYPFHKSFLGISHNEPPTDKKLVRQAILVSLDWEQLMAGIGPADLWFLCPAIYYCNTPLETDIGADEWYSQGDIPRAKALLTEAGYAGETVFIMNPADYATIAPLGPVLKAQLEDIGMSTEMPGMDWSTLISRVYDLGWSLFTSWSTHNAFGSPIHDLNNTDGGTGYGGGFTFPDQIAARKEFAFAATPAEVMAAVEKLQMAYFTNVPRIYGGQWSSIFPHRDYIKNLTVPSYPMYIHAWMEK